MKVLYVLSSPHGGSTLISHMLGLHPSVEHIGELTFINKLLALDELCTCESPVGQCNIWQSIFKEFEAITALPLGSKHPYGAYFGDAIKPKMGTGKVDHGYQTLGRRISAKLRGAYDTAVLLGSSGGLTKSLTLSRTNEGISNTFALYQAAARVHNVEWIVDASKAPRKAPLLYLKRPEQVRILHLTRDARSVCASRQRYMPVRNAAERWNHYHRLSLQLMRKHVPAEHRLSLRYEDLIAEPKTQLEKICALMGTDYHPDMLDLSRETHSHAAGGNVARFAFSGGLRQTDDAWRDKLNQNDLAILEKQAGKLNVEFGYT